MAQAATTGLFQWLKFGTASANTGTGILTGGTLSMMRRCGDGLAWAATSGGAAAWWRRAGPRRSTSPIPT